MRQLVHNCVECLECGEILVSHHRHDYKTCSCPNHTTVDGGLSYLRYGGMNMEMVKAKPVYADDDFELIRNKFQWGTYGKTGKDPLKYVVLKNMTNDHINKILAYMITRMSPVAAELFSRELRYRRENNIWIKDEHDEHDERS